MLKVKGHLTFKLFIYFVTCIIFYDVYNFLYVQCIKRRKNNNFEALYVLVVFNKQIFIFYNITN